MLSKTQSLVKISIPTPFPVGPINVFLLKGDSLALIDTGPKTKEALQALKRGLQQFGYTLRDIEMVILTHHHSDHAGLLDQFEHAKIYGHWRNEPWITHDEKFYTKQFHFVKNLFKQEGVEGDILNLALQEAGAPDEYLCKSKLDEFLMEGDKIPGFKEWKVIETPGHAQSHISFINEEGRSIIAGDNLIQHLFPTPLLEPPYHEGEERPKTLIQLRETLEKHLELNLKIAYSGHGDDIFNVRAVIEKLLNKHEERAFKVLNLLKEGNMTAFEISKRLFPNAYNRSTYLTMSETIGILDLLIYRSEISAVQRNDVQKEYRLL